MSRENWSRASSSNVVPGWAPRAHLRHGACSPSGTTGVLRSSSPSSARSSVVANGVGSGFGKWMQEAYADSFTSAFKPLPRRADKGRDGRDEGKGQADAPGGVPGSYDHVYIDVNNVLHVAAHHTKTEKAFFMKLFALLDLNMRRTKPQYTVTLALDGPAPIAKTITQRRRRIRLSSGEKVPLSEDPARLLKIGLTPGSTLSLKIDRALEYYSATRLLSRNTLPRGLLFEISGTRVPGEGEVKILRSMKARVENPKFEGHSHLIVSEDSDALLLAMTAAPADTFVLSSKLVFSVRSFNTALASQLPPGVALDGARRDFVALAVMMGNDYLPGSRFGVKYSWRAYVQLRSGERSGKVDGEGGSNVPSPSSKVAWGRYRDSPLFPAPDPLLDAPLFPGDRRPGKMRRGGFGESRVYEEGKLAFRLPPPVNWGMLRDFARVLADPEYVELQVSDGLRPRADVQRAINAAAAAAATLNQTIDLEDDEDAPGDELIVALIDDKEVVQKAPSFSLIPGVAGVVRAKLDPLRSARRAYEYIHGVGWVLEMYYTGACLDYGYHFQYSPREHNQGIAAAIDKKALDANSFTAGTTAFKANKSRNTTDVAAAAAAAAAANAAASQGSGGSGSGGASRSKVPPPAVDIADFLTLPLTYDPTLDPLRDRERAGVAYLNRYPITPLAYSLAVIPRGGRAMLAKGVRPLQDQGSPVHHLFKDDYCVTCIKHRIAAGPLERVIQQESGNGGGGSMGTASAKGNGIVGGAMVPTKRGRGARGARGGGGRGKKDASSEAERLLARKFAGGDEAIRSAARAGGDVAREALRRLNRRHLEHLSKAPQHAQDRPPPPLNDLEGAVARVSVDNILSEDEETLRTLGDQPVLIWHSSYSDPPDLDRSALTPEEDLPGWVSLVTPPGCRKLGPGMTDIRRYDGDASTVLSMWSVGGESPTSKSGPGAGGGPGRGGRGRQAFRNGGGFKKRPPRGRGGENFASADGDRKKDESDKGSPDAPASTPSQNRRWRRQPAGAAARRRTGEGASDGAAETKSDDSPPPPAQGSEDDRPMTPGDFRRRRSPGGFYGGRGRRGGTKPRALPPIIIGGGAFCTL